MRSAHTTHRRENRSGHPSHSETDVDNFEVGKIEQSIASRFEQVARRFPDHVAVRAGDQSLTYDRLNRAANRAARGILTGPQPVSHDVPVGLLLDQGPDQISAALGVLKAAGFYVPLDPANPDSRNRYMLEDSGADLIVTNTGNAALAARLAGSSRRILNIDEIAPDTPDGNTDLPMSADTLAYILYTSGSTGQPKGVVQNQRNVLHNVRRHANAFRITPADRQTLLYTASVYGGQRDMFNALLNGASLHVYLVKSLGVAGLADWLRKNRISIYCSVATIFRQFINTLSGTEQVDTLRLIKLGGEASHKRDVESFRKHFRTDCVMHCGLGATELGLARNFFITHDTTLKGNAVPLGYPADGMEVLLLDDAGRPAPEGEIGEIAVRSRYIALGYWQKPELTASRFQTDPEDNQSRIYRTGDLGQLHPDGLLEHRGRRDFQVKIRGNRVELAEVEVALLDLESIREAVVVACRNDAFCDTLVAYVVPEEPGAFPSRGALRTALAGRLPDYMIPGVFVELESLPLLPNGKVDRSSLPAPDRSAGARTDETHEATTPLEHKLAEIWAQALNRDRIGVNENFFELGGHSLAAVEIVAAIDRYYDRRLPPAALFEAGTVTDLARLLDEDMRLKPWSPLVPIQPEGSRPPLFCVHPAGGNVLGYSEFARLLGPDQPVYGIQSHGVVEGQEPHDSIEVMAKLYIEVIRARQPTGPYFLGGESFGGLVAYEMAQQLTRNGERVAFLFVGDTWSVRGPHYRPLRYALSHLTYPFTIPLAEWRALIRRRLSGVRYYEVKVKRYKFAEELRKRNSKAHRRASNAYIPEPYPGRVTLFRAVIAPHYVQRLQHYFRGPSMGWNALAAGGVDVHTIAATHREMMHGSNAPGFAATLRSCLDRAQA